MFLNSRLNLDKQERLVAAAELFQVDEGAEHFLGVASSLDSLVVGELKLLFRCVEPPIIDLAMNEVFAKDINRLDEQGKEVLEKVLTYIEKNTMPWPSKPLRKCLCLKINSSEFIK